jgi:hypothetical protein
VKRSHRTAARRRWPNAAWILGSGPFASVARCGVLTVMLHDTEADAIRALKLINGDACGHACYRDHALVNLEDPDPR